jgi:phage terminase large subunit-like protein
MAGVCYEQRLYLIKVLEGVLEADHYFGIIFTLDEGDDPFRREELAQGQPADAGDAEAEEDAGRGRTPRPRPSAEGNFKTKNLNLWLGAASAWLNMAQWKACASTMTWEDFDGLDVWIGADLADKDDITAMVLAAWRPSPNCRRASSS